VAFLGYGIIPISQAARDSSRPCAVLSDLVVATALNRRFWQD
jgi:hypothetical protein